MEKPASEVFDMAKIVEQFKLPGVDVSALMEARRKDIEALAEVNKIAMESSQAMAQKQVEILQKTLQELTQTMTGGKPLENVAKQAEVVQQLARRSQTEALEVIKKRRAQENMQELTSLVQSKQSDRVPRVSSLETQGALIFQRSLCRGGRGLR